MVVPTPVEKVTKPTRVLPLSISNLETSVDRNDFIWLKFVALILSDSSSTKMTSAGHSVCGGGGGGGDDVGGGVDGGPGGGSVGLGGGLGGGIAPTIPFNAYITGTSLIVWLNLYP